MKQSNSKNITLVSEYNLFDLLPVKKDQQLNIRIPQSILLEKGFIKNWIFNSRRNLDHPILKKNRANISTIAVVKMFCSKFGYGSIVQGCNNVKEINTLVGQALAEQKDYSFVKDKKVIEVTSVSNEFMPLSLLEFLNFVSNSDQSFYQKWKFIQERVSYAKFDEHYVVENTRVSHKIESKCEKVISVLAADTTTKQSNKQQSHQQQEQKIMSEETYKFVDTFLTKKFIQMSLSLIQFIEKNLKCIVFSINTKFVINKDRQPHLISMSGLTVKPARNIQELKEFQVAKKKGFLMVEQYLKFLDAYVDVKKCENQYIATQHRSRCRGRFCALSLQATECILAQKISNHRIIQTNFRDSVFKQKKQVLNKLIQNKLLKENQKAAESDSSEYETSEESEGLNAGKTTGNRIKFTQLKVCQNCSLLYFYVSYFYDIDELGNLKQKVPLKKNQTSNRNRYLKSRSERHLPPPSFFERNTRIEKKLNWQGNFEKSQLECSKQFQRHVVEEPKKSKNSKNKSTNILNKQLRTSSANYKLNSINSKPQFVANKILTLSEFPQSFKIQQFKARSAQIKCRQNKIDSNKLSEQILNKFKLMPDSSRQEVIFWAKKCFKDSSTKQITDAACSNYYQPQMYQFMSTSPICIHPKRRIKRRPEMSLKKLSQISNYPEIVSRSQFILDTLIVNEKTTISFCIITTKVVNPQNLRTGLPFQNVFIVNDIFDSFIEHISLAKELLEEQSICNKRIILFNYPGQSHTIYNGESSLGYSAYFGQVLDKFIFRLSQQKNQLKLIDLEKDLFKFIGIGFGGYLLSQFLNTYSNMFNRRISRVMLINSFMQFPLKYKQTLQLLLKLYQSGNNDQTIQTHAFLYYRRAISQNEIGIQELESKAGLNSIRIADRIFLLQSALLEAYELSGLTSANVFRECQVEVVHGLNNTIIPNQNKQFMSIKGGHDLFADNFEAIFEVITEFLKNDRMIMQQ